jgi:hypothetical protein
MFVLINEKDKKVYISYSSKFHSKLGSIVSYIRDNTWRWKDMVKDKKKLELKILETRVERHFVNYFRNEYRNNGYTLYNETERIPLQYQFKIQYTSRKVLVVAVNKMWKPIVLGRFETYEEARGFLLYIGHNNPAGSLCYSNNGVRV